MPVELPISAIGLLHLDAMHRAAARRRLIVRKVRRMFRLLAAALGWTPSRYARDLAAARAMGDDWDAMARAMVRTTEQLATTAPPGGLMPALQQNVEAFRAEVEALYPTQQYEAKPASRWRDLGEAGGIVPPEQSAEAAWQAYTEALLALRGPVPAACPCAPDDAHDARPSRFPETGGQVAVTSALAALCDPHAAYGETPAGFVRGWRDTLVAEWGDYGAGNLPNVTLAHKLDWLLMRLAEAEDALRRA